MTLKAPRAGQAISSSQWLQPVADELNKVAGPRTAGDRPPNSSPSEAAPGNIESATFIAEQANTITATIDSSGETITIAKPPSLRGDIATRINADGDTEEIHPFYHPGFKLLIVEVAATGLAGVTWADLNWNAARWAIEV